MASKRKGDGDCSVAAAFKKSKSECMQVNSEYIDQTTALFNDMKHAWKSNHELQTELVTCVTNPFNCWTINDFLQYREINELRDTLLKLKYAEKNNDLYQFKQSNDIQSSKSIHLIQFRNVLHDQVLPWLRALTDIELSEDIDASCCRYDYTDVLLCHDDECEGRRIAFVYYLVDPSWTLSDGGTLDLFNVDEYGCPKDIVHSIVPTWNSLVLFEVTPVSFHQVSEVLSASKPRLSISGWFHGLTVPRPLTYKEPKPHPSHPIDKPLDILSEWVNPIYLDTGVHSSIREQFENESQIELPNFLLDGKYEQLCSVLRGHNVWERVGPPNKRCVFKGSTGSSLINECMELFLSEPFCLLLSHFTELQLASLPLDHTSSDSHNPCCCYGNWYLWQQGNYTLASDDSTEEFQLEAILYFNTDNWEYDQGGYISYIAKDEDEQLLSVCPTGNSLQLVYKDRETLNFTKYINNRSGEEKWHSIETIYKENN